MSKRKTLEVETKLGTIMADPSGYRDDYPGIYLTLKRGDKTVGLCLLEVVQVDDEEPYLAARMWNPTNPWDTPSISVKSSKDTVDTMFDQMDTVEDNSFYKWNK